MGLMLLADVPLQTRYGIALSLILGIAAIGWPYAISRFRAGRPLVEPTMRHFVPWDGAIALIALIIYALVVQFFTAVLVPTFYLAVNPSLPPPLPDLSVDQLISDPAWVTALFQAQTFTNIAAMTVVLMLLQFTTRASWADFGLDFHDFHRKLKLGLIGFTVIFPPIMLLNGLLNIAWRKSEHPIIVGYRASGDETLFLWCTIAAVAVAPLVEEFIFRGVLQGWLERLFAERRRRPVVETGDSLDGVQPALEGPASTLPIIFSSLMFAAVHIQAGPDWISIFFLALGLGYLYRQTHSLWPGIIVHTLLNAWSMAALYFLPDA
ncbi:MAG: CPBP family intramembrane metalloprotease [Planctomycetales bacterium]|nr:CPBP family intramembrane metalloprotease [Planctomycetales bacterium]MBN8629091.1 CPBP family intramembrane metalloprotease [Planctomycetota bacterium]